MRLGLTFAFLLMFVAKALAAYQLQSGDVLAVSVWQDPKLDRQVVVAPDGRISFPLAGQIRAGGLTIDRLEDELARRLQDNYKEKLDVTVSLIRQKLELQEPERVPEIIGQDIFVTGEVKQAGRFTVTKPTTVLQAIALAGGLDIFAAKGRIVIQRKMNGEDVLIPFNYRAAVNGRDPWSNIYLQEGDVVIVPERGLLKGLF